MQDSSNDRCLLKRIEKLKLEAQKLAIFIISSFFRNS